MPFALPAYYGSAGRGVAPVNRNQWSVNLPGTAGSANVPGPDFLNNINKPPSTNVTVFLWAYPRQGARRSLARWGTNLNNDAFTWRIGSHPSSPALDMQLGNVNSAGVVRTSSEIVTLNSWQSLAFSITTSIASANIKMYKNGSSLPLVTNTSGLAPLVASGDFVIGWGTTGDDPPVYTNPYDGYIAMYLVWSSVLGDNEVLEIHNAGAGVDARSNFGNYTSSANLIRSWMMEEGTGTTTADEVSSPANDLTLNGSAGWYDQTGGAGGPP